VPGPAMIHVTRSRLSEIVVFGTEQRLLTPLALNAGSEIMVTSSGGDEIVVSKYSVQDGDQKRTVSTRVDDVLCAIVELGGTYPDVVQALQEAKTSEALPSRFEVDALPEAGRTYDRVAEDGQREDGPSGEKGKSDQDAKGTPARPVSVSATADRDVNSSGDGNSDANSGKKSLDKAVPGEETNTKKGFFARMLGR
jgi:hypothetical protein